MKKYFISFFIPILLNLLCGCSSTRFFSFEEAQSIGKDDPITIKDKRNRIFILQNFDDENSAANFVQTHQNCLVCQEWKFEKDTMTALCSGPSDIYFTQSGKSLFSKEYTLIAEEIAEISTSAFEPIDTAGMIIGIVALGGVILLFYFVGGWFSIWF